MTNHRVLDRKVEFDEKSRLYRAVSGIEEKPFRSYTWSCDVYNDQGYEGACVGFAWSHELSARPSVIPTDNKFALDIYRRARFLDPWKGEDYDGTSVLAGIKAVQERVNSKGKVLIPEYRWAFGIQDVVRVLGYKGPVVLGIEWHYGHYNPDENGQIWLGGGVAGGHAILAKGVKIVEKIPDGSRSTLFWENVDLHKSMVRLHNSWGREYGKDGDAYMSLYDLDYLLKQDGEACIPVVRSAA